MLDVHPPHEPVNGWKAALTHIAIIVVGLFIAVAIEQTVVHFHEAHQRDALEQQMREVLRDDLKFDEINAHKFVTERAYLADQRAAVFARLHHDRSVAGPPVDDPRMRILFRFPNLAPYEAAKQNGTVALLPAARLRLYSRLAFALDLANQVRDRELQALDAIAAFHERYTDSTGNLTLPGIVPGPVLDTLGPAELAEYLALLSTAIKAVDLLDARVVLFDAEARALLEGATTEGELFAAVQRRFESPAPPVAQ